jgi:hypothetical protein
LYVANSSINAASAGMQSNIRLAGATIGLDSGSQVITRGTANAPGNLAVQAQNLGMYEALLESAGNVEIQAAGLVNAQASDVVADGVVTVNSTVVSVGGQSSVAGTTVAVSGGAITVTEGGSLDAKSTLAVNSNSLTVGPQGLITGNPVALTSHELSVNNGKVQSHGDLSIQANGGKVAISSDGIYPGSSGSVNNSTSSSGRGGLSLKCSQARRVAMRPRGVRITKPS